MITIIYEAEVICRVCGKALEAFMNFDPVTKKQYVEIEPCSKCLKENKR
jgi:hypothetical protein